VKVKCPGCTRRVTVNPKTGKPLKHQTLLSTNVCPGTVVQVRKPKVADAR